MLSAGHLYQPQGDEHRGKLVVQLDRALGAGTRSRDGIRIARDLKHPEVGLGFAGMRERVAAVDSQCLFKDAQRTFDVLHPVVALQITAALQVELVRGRCRCDVSG